MKYYISAITDDQSDVIAREVEAVSLVQASAILYRLAVERWFGKKRWRATSVTEVPELKPMGLLFSLERGEG